MLSKFIKKRKAQAMVELAILGPLVLIAAGILITYTAKVNNDQYFLMEAFRYGLKKSHDLSKPTGYGTYDDRMQVSINRPILGEEMVSGGASYTMWAIPSVQDNGGKQEDPQSQVWAKLNDWGDVPGVPNQRDVTKAGSTSVTPTVAIGTGESINVTNNNGVVVSSRSGGAGGGMAYRVGKKVWVGFGRGHGAGRSYSATVSK
jgi:hypothetical protein